MILKPMAACKIPFSTRELNSYQDWFQRWYNFVQNMSRVFHVSGPKMALIAIYVGFVGDMSAWCHRDMTMSSKLGDILYVSDIFMSNLTQSRVIWVSHMSAPVCLLHRAVCEKYVWCRLVLCSVMLNLLNAIIGKYNIFQLNSSIPLTMTADISGNRGN